MTIFLATLFDLLSCIAHPFDAPNNNRADHQQENTNASADRKVQHPVDLAVAVHIQHIYRVYLIILRHLMEHGFFLGGCVPDIACRQLIAGAQHEIIVKVDADTRREIYSSSSQSSFASKIVSHIYSSNELHTFLGV